MLKLPTAKESAQESDARAEEIKTLEIERVEREVTRRIDGAKELGLRSTSYCTWDSDPHVRGENYAITVVTAQLRELGYTVVTDWGQITEVKW